MMEKDIVIMYTFSPFPFGDATANRIFSLAQSIQSSGYKVIVLSNGPERKEDYDSEKKMYVYENIEYRSYWISNTGKLRRIINRNNIVRILKNHLSMDERKRIRVIYSTYRNYGLILHILLKFIFRIPSIVDVTEWHSSSQFKFGKLNFEYILHTMRIRYLIPKAKNVICITEYLKNYFNNKGCNTVIIPPQVMIKKYKKHKLPPVSCIQLFYAGNIANKDHIDIVLDGLMILTPSELKNVKFNLIGLTIEDFKNTFPRGGEYINYLKDSLNIVNRITKSEVDERLSESHFLVLMRPNTRYSDAGFPSKVPEALAAGVPIITNYTSDLKYYIKDLKNGIIVDEFSATSFAQAMRKISTIDDNKFRDMSNEAYRTALNSFDYLVHKKVINSFILNIKN